VTPTAAQTLAAIKERDALVCGVSEGILGFSIETATGWTGFDVDFCRALAAAVLGDPGKVHYVPLNAENRFVVLKSGNIDVLSRNSSWTMSREVELKLVFPAATYFDGQGFVLRKARNATSALELDGAKVCVQGNTTTALNLTDYFRANDMKLERITFSEASEAVKAYDAGRCDVFTSDVSQLYA
jgi:general L-amino acid transport system substrate-binding protein